ncbi:hypothetical protein [Duganella sp. Root1480D1]|uniref:carbapenem self-resistance protein CarG family protein n=1 Tax=Duganella sp. Root1480D1 TaxID=1736471 RepID=UPI00070A5253|nr:hypothetical protein [Duganella sp. Root1480D1]KQZ39500.1 hypothetical protein ASD58_03630 [Duganella sp. Root1480D1]
MKTMHIVKLLCVALLAASPQLHAQTAITPQRDITIIDLGNEKVSMLYTHIDKNNAHPIDTVTFFLSNPSGAAQHIPYQINGRFEPILQLRSGADCAMTGFRAFKAGNRMRVVYAQRDGNWADKRRVTFTVMDLKKNSDEQLDTPPLYFQELTKVTTQASYCDVNTALDTEAGLYRMGK